MAQTTGAISSKEFKIETSTDGAAWEDQSGIAMKINPGQSQRMSGEAYTPTGDTPIITTGKRQPIEDTVEYVYTEGASELFEDVRAAHEADSDFYLRYSPKGGQAGEFQFSTAKGKVTVFSNPPMDAGSGAPVVCSFTLKHAGWTKSVVA